MSSYESAVLKRFGYSSRTRGCGQRRLCPAFSLPDLFRAAGRGGHAAGRPSSPQAEVERPAQRDPAVLLPGA